MFIRPERGGQLREATKCLIGAPEFVAEISGSSTSIDAGPKRSVYERIGVRECLIVRTYDQEIDWFTHRDGRFEPLPQTAGVIRSAVFPGLWLNVPALLAGDAAAVLQTLNQGLATPEFTAYRTSLSPDAKSR
jgi:Uma2 family endonuclease